MERKMKLVGKATRVLKLPAGLKSIVGKKKKLYDEVSVGEWVLDNEAPGEYNAAVILEKLPGGWLRLRRSTGEFKLPREKVSKLSEEALYQEKEQDYLAHYGKAQLTFSQRKELKEYCSKYLQWRERYPDANPDGEELTGVWGFLMGLCFLPFFISLLLGIPYVCLSWLGVVPELGPEVFPYVFIPILFAMLLGCIHKSLQGLGLVQETPGAKLKPDVPDSVALPHESFDPMSGS
jgi:hypothetical protein